MTVPMYPVFSPGQPQQAPPGYVQTQVPGYAPAPVYPQPGFAPQAPVPQQPGGYPQPQPPGMPQFPQGTDLNQRLYGPQFPQELQGKTLGEALRYYGVMREDFINRGRQQQQPLQGQPQQPQQPQQWQQQPAQQIRNPQGQFQSAQPQFPQQGQPDPMRQMIQEAVGEAIAPVVQQTNQERIEAAYRAAAGRFPDWQQFAPEVFQGAQGADARALANTQFWEALYFHAKGKRYTFPGQQGVPQQQGYQPTPIGQPQPYAPQMPQQQFPGGWGQQGGYPQQAGNVGFVEGPTPAAPTMMAGPGGGQSDPRDELFARRFGMPLEVYRMSKQNPLAAADAMLRARQQPGQVQYQQGPPMPGQQQQVPNFPPQQFQPQMNGGGYYGA